MATFGTVIKQFLSVNSIVLEDIEIEGHSSDGQPCPFYETHLVAPRRWRALDMGGSSLLH